MLFYFFFDVVWYFVGDFGEYFFDLGVVGEVVFGD